MLLPPALAEISFDVEILMKFAIIVVKENVDL